MTQPDPVVFLLDVDNTLLDNDRITADLKRHLTQAFGAERQERYWAIFEKLRVELGYADYLGALQRYRAAGSAPPEATQREPPWGSLRLASACRGGTRGAARPTLVGPSAPQPYDFRTIATFSARM